MTTEIISPFEVLGTPIAPGVGAIVLSQGYFLQLTNLKNVPVTIDIEYASTPPFVPSAGTGPGAVALAADIIKGTGVPPTLPVIAATVAAFLTAPVGFKAQTIPAHTTWLFGVQYIFPNVSAPPTGMAEARGVVTLKAPVGAHFLALATTRQAFFNYTAAATLLDVAESAYAIPLVRGPEIKS
jgi:hypothetical protein